MFISEVSEANWFKIETTQEEIDHSNNLFAELVANRISSYTLVKLHGFLSENYISASDCPVIKFNNDRLYYQDEESILAQEDLEDEDLDPAGGYGLSSHI